MLSENRVFWLDIALGVEKNYKDLISDLNILDLGKSYIFEKETYNIFLRLIHSLVYDYSITMLDSDFSVDEINALGVDIPEIDKQFKINKQILDCDSLVKLFYQPKTNWSITLFTSGTTGRPKKISHNLDNLTRFVRKDSKHDNNIWAFAYNPTHFAGLQVFFQAFYNFNTIVNLNNVDNSRFDDIFDRNQITNISATPTFYRYIIPSLKTVHLSVTKCTMGGEKFDSSITQLLKKNFPNAKFVNIYASTEAGSLFSSDGDFFYIPEKIKDRVSISESSELLIHKSLLGSGDYINTDNSDWYFTGDIVEAELSLNRFKIVSRNTEMINVGGYKVNPHEIEFFIKQIEGITDVSVYGRKNSVTGNIIAADVVKLDSFDEEFIKDEIRNYLKHKLQEWKIPRIVKFVDNLKVGRTGKKVR